MLKTLQDNYNGLVVILLKPYLPARKTLLALVIGLILGLIWGYTINPTIFYNAEPRSLEQSWQDQWVKLLADRYAAAGSVDVSSNIVDLLSKVDDPLGIVDRLIATPGEESNQAKLQAIRPLAQQAEPIAVSAPQPSNLIADILPFILAPIVVVIIATVVIILWGMFIFPNIGEPIMKRLRGDKGVSKEVLQERAARAENAKLMETKRTDFSAASNLGPPLMQRMSNYTPGFGTYDESYTIEDEQERFLGECGALVSETIGTGDPAKATAIECWLFDKDDFVRTVTKVFVSEYALNDQALRSKLEAKGDLVKAQPGAIVTMETNTLRLQARIVDMQYGTGAMPPNSYFEKMTIELAAWRKDGTGAPAAPPPMQQPVAAPMPAAQQATFAPLPTPPPAPFQPPPQQRSQPATAAAASLSATAADLSAASAQQPDTYPSGDYAATVAPQTRRRSIRRHRRFHADQLTTTFKRRAINPASFFLPIIRLTSTADVGYRS